jgi:hypothetical protein
VVGESQEVPAAALRKVELDSRFGVWIEVLASHSNTTICQCVSRGVGDAAKRTIETVVADTYWGRTSSDDDDSFNPSFSRTPSFEGEATSVNESGSSTLRTIRPLRSSNGIAATGEASRARSPAPSNISGHKRSKHPSNSSIVASPLQAMDDSPSRSETPAFGYSIGSPQTERSRSNSESTVGTNRDKRRGMPPPPRAGSVPRKPAFNPQSLRPVDEKPFKHTRGYSHDSVIDGGAQANAHVPARSPTGDERRPGQYFRRLSSLPEHKRSSLSSARVGEVARGILYSMSTIQHPIDQYVQSTGESGGTESKVGRALYNSKTHVSSLVSALEAYDAKDNEPAVQKVLDACQSCIAAFRQVLAMLQSSLKELGPGGNCPDVRYARTLVLIIYGAYVEIQCSYDILRPLMLTHSITDANARAGSLTSRHAQGIYMPYARQNAGSNASLTDSGASAMSIPPPLATPRSIDFFAVPPTPGLQPGLNSRNSGIGFDQADALYQKFLAATTAALSTLPQIDRDIKSSGTQSLQPPVALKLREISSLCMSGCDAARRLSKIRWEAIQEGDQGERKKFWDDTNKFTQVRHALECMVVAIANWPRSSSLVLLS